VEVNFKEGQNVKQGELLIVIDPRPYQAQLDQMQAQKFKDEATLRDAAAKPSALHQPDSFRQHRAAASGYAEVTGRPAPRDGANRPGADR